MMEPIHGTSTKASKFAPEAKDVISSMPNNVITNILNRLPIQDAVRTGILSRDWRFKWPTMLTQLVFDRNFYDYLSETDDESDYRMIVISNVLLQLNGDITKFYLLVQEESHSYVKIIDLWFRFVSVNGVEDFTLINNSPLPLTLPTRFSSCPKLKHLKLESCCFPDPMPDFRDFPNLLSVDLFDVSFGSYNCGEFLSQNPSLEFVKINCNCLTGVIKQVEIAKLEHLKVLSFPLSKLHSTSMVTRSSIFHLMGVFSTVKELTLDFLHCKFLADAENMVLTPLPCLEILDLYSIDFCSDIMVSCAIDLICGSPNLKTLMFSAEYNDAVPPPAVCSSEVDFSRIGQLQLQKVEFVCIRGLENEVCLMKSILASSPLLKRMAIYAYSPRVFGGERGERMLALKLLKLHRASPIAEIDLCWYDRFVILDRESGTVASALSRKERSA